MKIKNLKIVFAINWWDGPLEGMCLHNNEKHWFHCEDEDGEGFWRRFSIIKLTPEQVADEEKWHEFFKEKVGESFPYADGIRVKNETPLKPQSMWHEFYDVYKDRIKPEYHLKTECIVDYVNIK